MARGHSIALMGLTLLIAALGVCSAAGVAAGARCVAPKTAHAANPCKAGLWCAANPGKSGVCKAQGKAGTKCWTTQAASRPCASGLYCRALNSTTHVGKCTATPKKPSPKPSPKPERATASPAPSPKLVPSAPINDPTLAEETKNALCTQANGFRGGCPLLVRSAGKRGSRLATAAALSSGSVVSTITVYRTAAGAPAIGALALTFSNGARQVLGSSGVAATGVTDGGVFGITAGERIDEVRVWLNAPGNQLSGLYISTSGGRVLNAFPTGSGAAAFDTPALLLRGDDLGSGLLMGASAWLSNTAPVSIVALAPIFLPAPLSSSVSIRMLQLQPQFASLTPYNLFGSSVEAPINAPFLCTQCVSFSREISTSREFSHTQNYGWYSTWAVGGSPSAGLSFDVPQLVQINGAASPTLGLSINYETQINGFEEDSTADGFSDTTTITSPLTTFLVPPGYSGQCVSTYAIAQLDIPYEGRTSFYYDVNGTKAWSSTWSGTYRSLEATSFKTRVVLVKENENATESIAGTALPDFTNNCPTGRRRLFGEFANNVRSIVKATVAAALAQESSTPSTSNPTSTCSCGYAWGKWTSWNAAVTKPPPGVMMKDDQCECTLNL